jgi:hypothetical protein
MNNNRVAVGAPGTNQNPTQHPLQKPDASVCFFPSPLTMSDIVQRIGGLASEY